MKVPFQVLLLLALNLFETTSVRSQFIHLGLGYNANFFNPKGLNHVVNRYNELRDFLSKDMSQFKSMDGMTIQAAAGAAGFVMCIDYSWRGNVNEARGTVQGIDFRRQIKYKENQFAVCLGGVAAEEGGAFSGGLRFEFFNPRVYTRLQEGENEMPEWTEIGSPTLNAKIGPFFKMYFGPKQMWPATFFVSGYYCFGLFNVKMYELDEYLNGSDYDVDFEYPAEFLSKNSIFGLSVGYGLAFTE
jgi:hypothetical protein